MFASEGLGVGKRFCKFEKREFMGFAEKKVELFQIVSEADEETTGKLIEFAKQLRGEQSKFSKDELEKFHASRQQYLENPQTGLTLEEAHAQIRRLKKG